MEGPRLFVRGELDTCLGALLHTARDLAHAYHQRALVIAPEREPVHAEIEGTNQLIEDAVARFNGASTTRAAGWRELRALLGARRRQFHHLTRVERPLAELAFRYRSVLEDARARLEERAPRPRSTSGFMSLSSNSTPRA